MFGIEYYVTFKEEPMIESFLYVLHIQGESIFNFFSVNKVKNAVKVAQIVFQSGARYT